MSKTKNPEYNKPERNKMIVNKNQNSSEDINVHLSNYM